MLLRNDLIAYESAARDLHHAKNLLKTVRGRAYSVPCYRFRLDGIPTNYKRHSRSEDSALYVLECEDGVFEAERRLLRMEAALRIQIDAIEDARTRVILKSKYFEGGSWHNVALRLGAGETEESVKQCICRYFKKEGSSHEATNRRGIQ